ncbi:MAG: hypothetical protein JRH15_15725 [Deltaproteobacteria bacterium]|nr:hypothetical protein [Deltaproteobacteria bacterium]
MIHIEEIFTNERSVSIRVDGILDSESLKTLTEVMQLNLQEKMNITLNLSGLIHADREGKAYLEKLRDQVMFEGLSEFLKLEIGLKAL